MSVRSSTRFSRGVSSSSASGKSAVVPLEGPVGDPVSTGDVIILSAFRPDGVQCCLYSEGITEEDLFLVATGQANAGDIDDTPGFLFRVVPQLSYTARKELRRGDQHDPAESAEKLRQEEIENAAQEAQRYQLRNGDSLQLLHLRSGKFVSVLPKAAGRTGEGTLRVALQEGGTNSCLSAMPYYKYKGIGEPLLYGLQVLFAAHKPSPSWFLHFNLDEGDAQSEPGKATQYELNCSTEPQAGFFLKLFSRRSHSLQFGHTVSITCPQSDGILGASCSIGTPKRPYYRARGGLGTNEVVWSKGLWILQSPERFRGGSLRWSSQGDNSAANSMLCLRHVGTGHYLSVDVEANPKWAARARSEGRSVRLTRLVREPDETCRFVLEPLMTSEGTVRLGVAGVARALLRYEDERGPWWLSYDLHAFKKEEGEKVCPSLQPFFCDTRQITNAVVVECLTKTQKEFVADSTRILSWRANLVKAASSLEGCSEAGKADLFRGIQHTVSAAIRFMTHSPHLADCLKCPQQSSPRAQRLARELKFVDSSVNLMDALWKAGYKVTRLTSKTNVRLELPGQKLPEDRPSELPKLQFRCLQLLPELWRCCFQDNRKSEMYFLQKGWLRQINSLNGLGLGAGKCLAALVSNNRRLLGEVTTATIQTFVDFIGRLGPDEEWLRFLQALASCQGSPIVDKQQLVLQMVYDPGDNAPAAEKEKWSDNRQQLLLTLKLANKSKFSLPAPVVHGFAGRNLPGKSLETRGIRDVLVSWATSTERWEIDRPWLYFHPVHLDLPIVERESLGPNTCGRNWVSMEDLLAVMDPHQSLAPSHAKEADHKREGVVEARTVLSKFLVAQVDLIRELCLSNQVHAINAVQEEYSFDLICCILWDHSLAPTARQSFCELLNVLWVNRHPHLEVQLVPLCHCAEDLAGAKAGRLWLPSFQLQPYSLDMNKSSEFDANPSAAKFHVLVTFVRHHLATMWGRMVHSHSQTLGFTTAVMRLFLELLKRGFVSTQDQLVGILTPMLACLDGRTDFLDAPEVNLEAVAYMQHSGPTLESAANSTTCPPLVCTTQSVGPAATSTPLNSVSPSLADGHLRYKVEAGSALVDAKVLMCEVCAVVVEIAVGNGTTQLARLFMEWRGSGDPGQLFKPPTEMEVRRALAVIQPPQLDLNALAGSSLNVLLADLMMYESPELFVAAAKAMRLWNQRLDDVFKNAAELVLLREPAECRVYRQLGSQVMRLSEFISTSQCWGIGSAHGAVDRAKFHEAALLLEHLRHLCSRGPEGTDSDVPDERMQSMMASLRLGEELMRAFESPPSSDGGADGVVHELIMLVCKLLFQFASGHTRNQEALYRHLPKLQEWIGTGNSLAVSTAVAGIFHENRHISEMVPQETIFEVGQALVRNRRNGGIFQPQRLDFLFSILMVDSQPILRNKELVLAMLRSPAYEGVLHLLPGDEGLDRRDKLLEDFRSYRELEKPSVLRTWRGGSAELQYHNKTLELLGALCAGRDQSGASAFVQSKLPPNDLVRSYVALTERQGALNCSWDTHRMCNVLKRSLLAVLTNVYYDTSIMDVVFLSTQLHARLLSKVLDNLEQLQAELVRGDLSRPDRELILQILRTLTAFMECTPKGMWYPEIEPLLLRRRLHPTLTKIIHAAGEERQRAQIKEEASRALGWLDQREQGMAPTWRFNKEGHMHRTPGPDGEEGTPTDQLTSACAAFIEHLHGSPVVKAALEQKRAQLIREMCNLRKFTDPTDRDYLREGEASASSGSRPRIFRRNAVTVAALVQRAVHHSLQHLRDWDTTCFVVQLLCDILASCRKGPELAEMQLVCSECGGPRLVVDGLCARPELDLVQLFLRLANLMLQESTIVQQAFTNCFLQVDDSALWALFRELIGVVILNVKSVRRLKRILQQASDADQALVLKAHERASIDRFAAQVQTLRLAVRFFRLLCEGHNTVAQRYIFQQVDNSSSINVLEMIVRLCSRLCKNESAANFCDGDDADCLTMCFEMLSEVTTGPDCRNQEWLVGSEVVPCAASILRAPFNHLRRENKGSCYPFPIRNLKTQVSLLLLILLELRQDPQSHHAIIMHISAKLVAQRITFAHRWFLSNHAVVGNEGKAQACNAAFSCVLDDPSADDGIEVPADPPDELVDDYEETDLNDMFGEAFNLMLLARNLKPHDPEFAKELEPVEPSFDQDLKLRVGAEAFARAEAAYKFACKYRAAYLFFGTWMRMIEIQVDGRVFDLHFRMPTVCNYVFGRAKDDILTEVTIASAEGKLKEFIGRCVELLDSSRHIQSLSKWSPPFCSCLALAQRGCTPRPFHFFLKNNSQNLNNSFYFCYAIALLLNLLLFQGLVLRKQDQGLEVPGFKDETVMLTVLVAALVYLTAMLASLFVVCVIRAPVDHVKVWQDSQSQPERIAETTAAVLAVLSVAIAPHIFGGPVWGAALLAAALLHHYAAVWQHDGHHCPRNPVARFVATAFLSLSQEVIVRRIVLSVCVSFAIAGAPVFYTFLLLDLLFLFEKLDSVLKAVTIPLGSVALTSLAGVVVMYEFATIGFYYLREDFGRSCENMLDCTMSTIYGGLRSDDAEFLNDVSVNSSQWYGRVAFDVSFFMLIVVLLMNSLLAFVVDTFATLRQEKSLRERYFSSTTFIACLERSEVDKAAMAEGIGSGFELLENERQHCWNYMNFIFYLRLKDESDFTGPETYISRLVADESISWLPLHNCSLLQRQQEQQGGEPTDVTLGVS